MKDGVQEKKQISMLYMYFQFNRYWAAFAVQVSFFIQNQDALELQSVARAPLKCFTGVEWVMAFLDLGLIDIEAEVSQIYQYIRSSAE